MMAVMNAAPEKARPTGSPASPDVTDEELVILVIRTAKAFIDRLRSEHPTAATQMTAVHGLAMRYLAGRDDVTAGDLARHLKMTKQSASEAVAVLESAGLVERVPHPTDGRARVLRLTKKGRTKLDERRKLWRGVEDEWADLVGRDQLDVVRDALLAYLAAAD